MFCSTTQTEKRKSKWNVEMNLNEETFKARFSEMVGSSPESSPECRNFVKITEWGHALQWNRTDNILSIVQNHVDCLSSTSSI